MFLRYTNLRGPKVVAQLVKCLPHKHKNPSQPSRTHIKSQPWWCRFVILGLIGQSANLALLERSKPVTDPVSRIKAPEKWYPRLTPGLPMHKHPGAADIHLHTHTLTHKRLRTLSSSFLNLAAHYCNYTCLPHNSAQELHAPSQLEHSTC